MFGSRKVFPSNGINFYFFVGPAIPQKKQTDSGRKYSKYEKRTPTSCGTTHIDCQKARYQQVHTASGNFG